MEKKLQATEEQLAYARFLDLGMKLGMLSLLITFVVYVAGIFPPYLQVSDLPKYWSMPVKQYLKETGIHPGWTWLGLVGKGDFINFLGIAFLSGVTMLCYMVVIPIFFRKKDTIYGVLAVIEVLVLALAASGILKGGGH